MAKTQIRLQAVTGSLAASGDSRDYAIKANTDGALPAAAAAEAIDVGDLAGILQQYGNAISRISGKGDWSSRRETSSISTLELYWKVPRLKGISVEISSSYSLSLRVPTSLIRSST